MRGNRCTQIFGQGQTGLERTGGHQHGKFLATNAADEPGVTDDLSQAVDDSLDHCITGGMAKLVVDVLEVVDVQHHHHRSGFVQGLYGQVDDCAAIQHAGDSPGSATGR